MPSKLWEAKKAFAIAQTVMDSAIAYNNALKAGSTDLFTMFRIKQLTEERIKAIRRQSQFYDAAVKSVAVEVNA